jgi:hypothetical protein
MMVAPQAQGGQRSAARSPGASPTRVIGGQNRPDPLATIATLAQLRDAGALTEDEFQIQKARLLSEL